MKHMRNIWLHWKLQKKKKYDFSQKQSCGNIMSHNDSYYIDSILTEEDYLSLQEYRKEKASGILTSHEDLKNELGI